MQGIGRLRPLSALLALALLLSAPWCVQAGSTAAPRAEAAAGFGFFLDWLAGVWGDAGCTFDPNGACRDADGSGPATDSDSLDAGCIFDPNGGGCRGDL